MMNSSDTIFSALAEPRRREIVEMLAGRGQMSASDISDRFKITAAAISQHLRVLREARVVRVERQAQKRLYDLNPESMDELEEWAHKMKVAWEERFDVLDELLSKEKSKD